MEVNEISKKTVLNKRRNKLIKRVKEKFGEGIRITGDYQDYYTPIEIECLIHGKYSISIEKLMNRKTPCSECRKEAVSKPKKCEICGSTHDVFTRKNNMTLCRTHHTQILKEGVFRKRNVLDDNEIKIVGDHAEMYLYNSRGEFKEKVKIDIEDIERIQQYKWHIQDSAQKYVASESFDERSVRLHRFLMDCPKDKIVDHIDRDIFNYRKNNLRICSRTENNWNAGIRKDNKTGVRGVFFDKNSSKYKAHIQVNKKRINLGSFLSLEEAKKVRRKAEQLHYGEYTPDWGDNSE